MSHGVAGEPLEQRAAVPLLGRLRYFSRGTPSDDGRVVVRERSDRAEEFYRDRWRHDKRVRSTHGVNCTGSCSWWVYVREGIVSWEEQALDYPATTPDMPDEEPRGCPRGAAFSWYIYNPSRIKYPYLRGPLLDLWREARRAHDDPVDAWASIVGDAHKRAAYVGARGHGGFVRATWDEALELAAAAHVHTIKEHGPDRVGSVSPIPAMSPVSHVAGSRYVALTGGAQLSFYDWYADLPPASPQVFGDQTDVPESADWWHASYLILWGSNVPVTRTPDAHFMVEARYRGTKVVVASPDYAEHVKFADDWLAVPPGADGAVAMAMGHVVLKEFYVDRPVPFFTRYAKTYTDTPFLVLLEERDGGYVPDRFLTAADLGQDAEAAAWKPALLDGRTGEPFVPNGSQGFRWTDSGLGRWNLDLGEVDPALTLLGRPGQEAVEVLLPRFDTTPAGLVRRSVPALRVGVAAGGGGVGGGETATASPNGPGAKAVPAAGRLVTTVFDLLLAHYGVERPGLRGEWPQGYDDAAQPYTPAWQEKITRIPGPVVARVAREFAHNAEVTEGRSMIIMGSGVNHWFNSDIAYRAIMTLLLACGTVGRNGGGWAHYVGQEKIRPLTGWATLAGALDWMRPPRQNCGTEWYYVNTDQWRYEVFGADALASPLARGLLRGKAPIDALAQAERLGWQLTYPTFDRNPLTLAEEILAAAGGDGSAASTADPPAEAGEAGGPPPAGPPLAIPTERINEFMVDQITGGRLKFAVQDPDDPVNWPRVLFVWRANLIGSSGKGHEYFVRHLIGSDVNNVLADEAPPERRPADVVWRDPAPLGKLDLLVTLDFRMTSTGAFADLILPAATWYEKPDLSCTDLHPYVHSFNAAVDPPWEARSDWDAFRELARVFSRLAERHLGVRHDLVPVALAKDTPAEQAQPSGRVRDWASGEVAATPGATLPQFSVVRRDYGAVYDRFVSLGPLVESLGVGAKGVVWKPGPEVEWLRAANGVAGDGSALAGGTTVGEAPAGADPSGRPSLYRAEGVAETILALSGATNGRVAQEGFRFLERRVGKPLAEVAGGEADARIRWSDVQARPQKTLTSPEWSGDESGDRQYSAFTINRERLVPWRTLTGRMHFFLDHQWIAELGEQLPTYRPPLNMPEHYPETVAPGQGSIVLRYLTPHSKWSIHTDYQDDLLMLTLFRGGPVLWLAPEDAASIGVADNDWIEMWNRNGVLDCRAVVSPRMPKGLCYMYHAKDRHVQVPRTEKTGRHGGTHNSLTRLLLKPTHMIGGYSQLSYALNYYGCCGSQRDEVVIVRRRDSQDVSFR